VVGSGPYGSNYYSSYIPADALWVLLATLQLLEISTHAYQYLAAGNMSWGIGHVTSPCAPCPRMVVLRDIGGDYGIREMSVFVGGDHRDRRAEMKMCCPLHATPYSRELGDSQALERLGVLYAGSLDPYTYGVRLGGLSSGMLVADWMLVERNRSWLAFQGLEMAEVKELNLSGTLAPRSFARMLYPIEYVSTNFTLIRTINFLTVSSSLFLAAGLEAAT